MALGGGGGLLGGQQKAEGVGCLHVWGAGRWLLARGQSPCLGAAVKLWPDTAPPTGIQQAPAAPSPDVRAPSEDTRRKSPGGKCLQRTDSSPFETSELLTGPPCAALQGQLSLSGAGVRWARTLQPVLAARGLKPDACLSKPSRPSLCNAHQISKTEKRMGHGPSTQWNSMSHLRLSPKKGLTEAWADGHQVRKGPEQTIRGDVPYGHQGLGRQWEVSGHGHMVPVGMACCAAMVGPEQGGSECPEGREASSLSGWAVRCEVSRQHHVKSVAPLIGCLH